MPNLSDKGIYLPPSPIRKLVPFAEAAKRRGIKVYHLNIGQPDIRTPQVAVDAVKNIHDQVFEYGHSAGNESYRRKLADYYRGVGIDVTTDDMVITVGGSEAIFMAMTICLNPGDEVLVPEPFYANYNGFAMEAGVNIKPISSTIANDFALPPMEEFERLITTRTKAILICNPNNPTGYVYSEQEYEQLKNIVLKHDLYLMADEVYREFCYDGTKCISVMNLKAERRDDRLGVETLQHVRRASGNPRIAESPDHRCRAENGAGPAMSPLSGPSGGRGRARRAPQLFRGGTRRIRRAA